MAVVIAAIIGARGDQLLAASSSSATHAPGEADGAVPDGVTVFDDEIPAVANLDPALLGALRQAATDAAGDGVKFYVNSGWRSPEYQDRLLRGAISEYGSEEEAARWVATPEKSPHVSGDAVDMGPSDAAAWLSVLGAEYGLCQIYRNEPWHYELRPKASINGCPPMNTDPTQHTSPLIYHSSQLQESFGRDAGGGQSDRIGNGEGEIPQSGDLCSGTGGTGQIVSTENNTFVIKREDGRNQFVNLTGQATIKTSTGSASASDLKIGYRVTLVGDPNPDGSFTADTVVVCAGTGPETQSGQNKVTDVNNLNAMGFETYFYLSTVLLFGLTWLGIVTFLRLKRRKSLVYLLFFTIFYVYLFKVLDYTLLQFQSLILLKYFMLDLILNGQTDGKGMNLIPLITLTLGDVKTSVLNILLLIPFGFGLPFITNLRMKKIVVIGALFSIVIEFLQLITGFMAKLTFRIADINDVIFNTVGVAIGYILFVGFVCVYRHTSHNWEISANPLLRYIAERPQIDKQ